MHVNSTVWECYDHLMHEPQGDCCSILKFLPATEACCDRYRSFVFPGLQHIEWVNPI